MALYGIKVFAKIVPLRSVANPGLIMLCANLIILS